MLRPVLSPAVFERTRKITGSPTFCDHSQPTIILSKTSAICDVPLPRLDMRSPIPRPRRHVYPLSRKPRPPSTPKVSTCTALRLRHVYRPRPSIMTPVFYFRLHLRLDHVCHVFRRRLLHPYVRYVYHMQSSARASLLCQLSHIAGARYVGTCMRIASGTKPSLLSRPHLPLRIVPVYGGNRARFQATTSREEAQNQAQVHSGIRQ